MMRENRCAGVVLFTTVAAVTSVVALGAAGLDGNDPPPVFMEVYVSGLNRPLAFEQDPGNPSLQYVAEKGGTIRVIQNGVLLATPFLNITDRVIPGAPGEQGLIGMAFDPDYANTGRFYVHYINPQGDSHIARYLRSAKNPLLADHDSEELILFLDQPHDIHNGGHLAFGPDGYLYIGIGDGGPGNDPQNRAQDPNQLFGKMLRIDVSTANGYAVPPDNPFLDGDPINALPEIWSFGFRAPWRYTFDDPARGGTGGMFIGDVGQSLWEELNYEPPGAGGRNYGWRNKEGLADFNNTIAPAFLPLTNPFLVHDHATSRAIIAGYVYRGEKLGSAYQGRFFYGEHPLRRVWSLALDIDGSGNVTILNSYQHTSDFGGGSFFGNAPSFGVDSEGELYLCSLNSGKILKIVPEPMTELDDFTVLLGTHLSGGSDELEESDNQYLRIRSTFGFSVLEPDLTEVEFIFRTDRENPIRIDFEIEDAIDHPIGFARLRVRNPQTSQWPTIATHNVNMTDTLHAYPSFIAPAQAVDNDGEVRLRVRHVVPAAFSALGFIARIDRVWMEVY